MVRCVLLFLGELCFVHCDLGYFEYLELHHWSLVWISCSSVFAVIVRMVNLWMCTWDSMTMNSEDHSDVLVDVNDQRD